MPVYLQVTNGPDSSKNKFTIAAWKQEHGIKQFSKEISLPDKVYKNGMGIRLSVSTKTGGKAGGGIELLSLKVEEK